MSIKRRRRKSSSNENFKKTMFFIGVAIIAAVGFYIYQENKGSIKRDQITQCRLDGMVSQETALVIDATDSFSPIQAMLVKKEVKSFLENSLVDERITLYVLDENVNEKSDRFSVCNPGDGSDKSELTSNKRRLRQKWETLFYKKVAGSVDELVGEHSAIQSPLLEMVKFVSVNTMYDSPALDKRMIIVSDMLHHTSKYSHYRQKPNYETFATKAYALEQKPYLSDVEVNILYLVRPKDMKRQNRGHVRFWEKHFAANGGILSNVKTVN